MQGTAAQTDTHDTHAHDLPDRTLPAEWRWWGLAAIIFALYFLALILHWTGEIEQIPLGISTLAHMGTLVLFITGCLTYLLGELRGMTSGRAVADVRDRRAVELQSEVADLQRWRKEIDSPNVLQLQMLREIKAVDARLNDGGPDR